MAITTRFLVLSVLVQHALSYTSTFTGQSPSALLAPPARRSCPAPRSFMDMKKGKPNVPPQMRGNYKQQKKMQEVRENMEAASTPGQDGMPIFNLFVRSPKGNMWYPCGSFKGDEKSAALAASWRDGGLLSTISKNQLDSGVSGSLAQDQRKLEESIIRGYPQLRKSRNQLEYGYKLAYEGLSDEQTKMNIVKPEKKTGFADQVKGLFGQ
mmetsp:Transcript_16877/g.24726  ORF Transcript_16877/g.24726 Transcript_16877/m.24726 type:complete len:210 (-) Transcript_16877:264-893(-)|eukprot:CAMPEP_0195512494 /NCGR_PEP_ID=MMETSP0794_2-20130614/4434_1 /TAXON_ID=515487 /ORGANISM="Stephanopyxis turris, Strain CCMP 815" /LENGTH=209 /DNA_ID=CAMNT_0040640289 /DNA_START=82 /DNA_END=711 /DNA_ORIENTATION=-